MPALVLAAAALCAGQASGQVTAQQAPPPAAETHAKKWTFSASAYT